MWKIHVGIILLPFQFEENTSQFDIFLILYRKYWHELMKSKKGFYNMHTMIQFQYVCHCMLDVNGLLGKNYFTCECALFNNNSIEEFLLDAKTIY